MPVRLVHAHADIDERHLVLLELLDDQPAGHVVVHVDGMGHDTGAHLCVDGREVLRLGRGFREVLAGSRAGGAEDVVLQEFGAVVEVDLTSSPSPFPTPTTDSRSSSKPGPCTENAAQGLSGAEKSSPTAWLVMVTSQDIRYLYD